MRHLGRLENVYNAKKEDGNAHEETFSRKGGEGGLIGGGR